MSDIIIYPESLSASVIGKELSAKTPTELYIVVMTEILKNRPQIIGQKETHFTADPVRAGQYTGTTREIYINSTKVYIKTGLSTKDKWKGIEKTCQLAGLTFEVSYEEPPESVGDIFGLDDDFFADFGVSPNPFQETSSTEPFVPTSPFAFHSEYYVGVRNSYDKTSCAGFDKIVSCDGRIYATGDFIHCCKFRDSNTIFEIVPDNWSVRAIVSEDKYFTGDIAVNRNGIFRISGSKFYLFDMNGKMKSKVTIQPAQPSGMYIYDSKIYSLISKGKVYEYDILKPDKGKVIWDISDIKDELNKAVASYLLENNFVQDFNGKTPKFPICGIKPKKICANDKRIIVGYRLDFKLQNKNVGFMLHVNINTQDYSCSIIDVSDERAEYKVFSFDMEKDIMWWWTGDNKSRHLFCTEIKPLDFAVRRNPQYSYHIFEEGNEHSVLSHYGLNFYFDGKSASANDRFCTGYFCTDGTSEWHWADGGYQSWDNYILGDWMYRPNMGQMGGYDKYICLIPHKADSFRSSANWHKITSEEFERAYQKAIGK